MDYRALIAAGLGILLGGVLLVAPEAIVRVHLAGRVPSGRRGPYGEDGTLPRRSRLLVRAAGVGLVAVGCYLGWTVLA